MEDEMRGIGGTARESGLSVSALRFYDRAGVLVPEWVDPATGYRWYTAGQVEEARLLAALRRARMPLADVRLVLAGWSGSDTRPVGDLLAAHLRRLENALSDARVQLSTVRSLIARREPSMTTTGATTASLDLTLPAAALAAALDAVRFAVSGDPELPALNGVLFDAGPDGLTLVATDRYRLAVAPVAGAAAAPAGASVRAVVPTPLADAARALLTADGEARIAFDAGRVSVGVAGRQVAGECGDQEFPDHRRLTALPAGRRCAVSAAGLAAAAAATPVDGEEAGPTLTLLAVGETLDVVADPAAACGRELVAVNRDFLCAAIDAAGGEHLVAEVGGCLAPLVLRPAHGDHFSLLMPVRLPG